MPLPWTITIYASTYLFALTSWVVRHRTPWLALYLFCCFPASIIWALHKWDLSRDIRPILLMLQCLAVIEAIALLHRNCWEPQRRYLFAGFCGLCAITLSFATISYPGYPETLWRVQLAAEALSIAGIGASLVLLKWFGSFRPAGWTIGNALTMLLYSGVEVAALLFQCVPKGMFTAANWIQVDITLALVQDCCLLWWSLLNSKD